MHFIGKKRVHRLSKICMYIQHTTIVFILCYSDRNLNIRFFNENIIKKSNDDFELITEMSYYFCTLRLTKNFLAQIFKMLVPPTTC